MEVTVSVRELPGLMVDVTAAVRELPGAIVEITLGGWATNGGVRCRKRNSGFQIGGTGCREIVAGFHSGGYFCHDGDRMEGTVSVRELPGSMVQVIGARDSCRVPEWKYRMPCRSRRLPYCR
jgi:hypothetical protein